MQLIKLIFSLLVFTQTCTAQNMTSINDAWGNLKAQLQKRSDVVVKVASTLVKSELIDQEELKKAAGFSAELTKYLGTLKSPDSLSISFTYALNTRLTQALARTLVSLERDYTFKNTFPVRDLLDQLAAVENS